MEPAGVTLPLVLGHENAGWVEAVGDRRDDGCRGRRGARLPAVQLRPLCRVPARQRHALRAPPVHRPVRRRRLRRVRPRLGALARCAARRGRACGRRPARRRRASPPTTLSGAWPRCRAGHDCRRDRSRRRRPYRAPARPRARSSADDRHRHRREAAAARGGARADDVLEGEGSVDAVRDLTDGRGADLVFDFVGTDPSHARSAAMLARSGHVLDRRLRRPALDPLARRWSARRRRRSGTSRPAGPTCRRSSSCMPRAGSS